VMYKTVCFFFKTKRRCDLDNQNKLMLDALTGIAYEDDSQISSLHLSRAYDATNSRMDHLRNLDRSKLAAMRG
jgi:Holliday junction resolvase RusA-like endonuclease